MAADQIAAGSGHLGYPEALGRVVGAHGATLELADGGRLIDLAGGGFGYGDARVTEAVAEQMRRLPLSTRSFVSRPLADLVRRLAELGPADLDVSYVCNSGAEALDGAIKLARGRHPRRLEFVVATPAPAAGGGPVGPSGAAGDVHRSLRRIPALTTLVPHGDTAAMERAMTGRTCAFVLEPVLTRAGVAPPPAGYLAAAQAACHRTGALLIADEIGTGLGRTGHWLALDREGVIPDVLVLGSSLGGGVLPMGAYVTRRRLNNRVYGRRTPALHATTTGGNPAACVAALAALAALTDDDVAGRARRWAEVTRCVLDEAHRRWPRVVSGLAVDGLLASLSVPNLAVAAMVQDEALRCGTLVLRQGPATGPAWLLIRPPLRIGLAELRRGLDGLVAAVGAVAGRLHRSGRELSLADRPGVGSTAR